MSPFYQIHITTLCITISFSATVALACLFSPKVYIILVHPEKNMRLTKQLKAQVNSMKFASQIVNNINSSLDHLPAHRDLSTGDGQSKSMISNDRDDPGQAFVANLTVTFKSLTDHHEKNPTMNSNNRTSKLKTSITIDRFDRSETGFNDEHEILSMDKSSNDENMSLNSRSMHHEQVML
jgi:hypothetical protein